MALPFDQSQFDSVYKEPLTRVAALFEWRLQTSGDIPDWESHHATTVDFVGTIDQLPPIVQQAYTRLYNQNTQRGDTLECKSRAYYELPAGLSLWDQFKMLV